MDSISGFSEGPKNRFLVYRISFGRWEENKRQIADFLVGLNLPGDELCFDPKWHNITPRTPPQEPPQEVGVKILFDKTKEGNNLVRPISPRKALTATIRVSFGRESGLAESSVWEKAVAPHVAAPPRPARPGHLGARRACAYMRCRATYVIPGPKIAQNYHSGPPREQHPRNPPTGTIVLLFL